MILAIPAALLLLALIVAPQLWITSVMKRHGSQRPAIPWTGGEFARLLLDGMKLTSVKVEETASGDQYHPLATSVPLKTNHYFGRSLTAIVIAAHEVGHAMQDATGYAPLQTRTRIAGVADFIHKIGAVLVIASTRLLGVITSGTIPSWEIVSPSLRLERCWFSLRSRLEPRLVEPWHSGDFMRSIA